jgi:Fe-S cluster biosynthesis and repair protein YggX
LVPVRYDSLKNRVYTVFEGTVKEEEALQYKKDMLELLPKIKTGCTLLVDATKASTHPPETVKIIQEVREAWKTKLKKSAVIVNSAVLKMQLNRTIKQIEDSFHESYFSDIDEAERYLNI